MHQVGRMCPKQSSCLFFPLTLHQVLCRALTSWAVCIMNYKVFWELYFSRAAVEFSAVGRRIDHIFWEVQMKWGLVGRCPFPRVCAVFTYSISCYCSWPLMCVGFFCLLFGFCFVGISTWLITLPSFPSLLPDPNQGKLSTSVRVNVLNRERLNIYLCSSQRYSCSLYWCTWTSSGHGITVPFESPELSAY